MATGFPIPEQVHRAVATESVFAATSSDLDDITGNNITLDAEINAIVRTDPNPRTLTRTRVDSTVTPLSARLTTAILRGKATVRLRCIAEVQR
jgi:hypothetical protein